MSETESFDFELVSPEAVLSSQRVYMAVIPGDDGYFGVLQRHIPMVKKLGPGILFLYSDAHTIIEKTFISGGFAEISAEKCVILADSACKLKQLPGKEELHSEIESLEETHNITEEEKTRRDLLAKIHIARAKYDALTSA